MNWRTCHKLKLWGILLFFSTIHEEYKPVIHQSVYISDDEITKRIWTAYFVHWCYLLDYGNVILPSTENYSSTLIFPRSLKALGKYEGFRSNFGLGPYDVITVQ